MKLSRPVALGLAIFAGVLEIVQQYAITASSSTHTAISFALIVLMGVGVAPLAGEAIGKLIPLHYAAMLTALAGVLQTVQQGALSVSPTVHAAVAVVLLIAAAIGIAPGVTATPPAVFIPVTKTPATPATPAAKTTPSTSSGSPR